ncbi:alcohol dehydrogenase [Lacticaseibacillus thailandensis]|uniref:alcohol dehydrogenase n=1 Tax=Lacticaseibacillus thailandensis TaxID=381741 RepID=UPI000AC8FC8D|nr:alcohol dehydrogenase [Lacticaseibacillus thailandensis]
MTRIDLTGQRFGRLTVFEFASRNPLNGNANWLCRCDCGNEVIVDGYRLRKGQTQSCGCYRAEVSRKNILSQEKTRAQMVKHHISEKAHVDGMTVLRSTNSSGVVGVSFDKQSSKWVARMMYEGRLVLNEQFHSFEAACNARFAAEERYIGPEKLNKARQAQMIKLARRQSRGSRAKTKQAVAVGK